MKKNDPTLAMKSIRKEFEAARQARDQRARASVYRKIMKLTPNMVLPFNSDGDFVRLKTVTFVNFGVVMRKTVVA